MSREDPIAAAPPLALLSALAALSAMAVNRVLLPLADRTDLANGLRGDRTGDFLANTAAVAGIVALSAALLGLMQSGVMSLRRRLMVASFAGILLPSVAVATVLDRERTTMQIVLFAVGACHVLTVLVCASAARATRTRLGRAIAILLCTLGFVTLLGQVLTLMNEVQLTVWQAQAATMLLGVGEVAYLATLAALSLWCAPRGPGRANLAARAVGLLVLTGAAIAVALARDALGADYALVLYSAQRVSLLVEPVPLAYALPLGMALAGTVAGSIATDPIRGQAALGLGLLLASGHAPHAPGRLLSTTLAAVLVARALLADRRVPSAE